MMMYALLRPILHMLDPERAHGLAIWALRHEFVPACGWTSDPMLATECFGRRFVNPIGLAAGFDKNAEAVSALARQGFGFLEVGSITLRPQDGNPKPRIFRLSQDQAIINRLGFNNQGVENALHNLGSARPAHCVIGVNIGKNKDSQDAVLDYVQLLQRVHDHADYITINVSSPNTQGLRDLQQRRQLSELLRAVMDARAQRMQSGAGHVPILLKISPDIDKDTKEDIAALSLEMALDGMIVSNTTIKRPATLKSLKLSEQGGLSGGPLMDMSTHLLGDMYQLTQGKIPLIGVGGIASAEDAYQKILHGASLIQLYTALTYQGFGLIKQIHDGLVSRLKRDGYASIRDAVGKAFV